LIWIKNKLKKYLKNKLKNKLWSSSGRHLNLNRSVQAIKQIKHEHFSTMLDEIPQDQEDVPESVNTGYLNYIYSTLTWAGK